jgi:hypothetical protein
VIFGSAGIAQIFMQLGLIDEYYLALVGFQGLGFESVVQ